MFYTRYCRLWFVDIYEVLYFMPGVFFFLDIDHIHYRSVVVVVVRCGKGREGVAVWR